MNVVGEVPGATLSASTHFFPLMATFLVAQTIKHLPTMRETRIQSLRQEDLLEKEMATHSSLLAWKFPWTEEPGRLYSVHGVEKSQAPLSDFSFTFL